MRNKSVKRTGCIVLAIILTVCGLGLQPGNDVNAEENLRVITEFEPVVENYKKEVEQGTGKETLGFPDTVRAVISEEIVGEFVQHDPGSELAERYGYKAPENEAQRRESGERIVYTLQNVAGEISGYRVYGICGEDQETPCFYASDPEGEIIGVVEEVPVTWECGDYDGNKAGEYVFTMILDKGYDCKAATPQVTVLIKEDEEEKEQQIQTEEEIPAEADNGVTPYASSPTSVYMSGQTRLVITKNGMIQYWLSSNTVYRQETSLNPDGYRIWGTANASTVYDLVDVQEDVTATLIFDDLTLTNDAGACVDVTGSDTTIILEDNTTNNLTCSYGTAVSGRGALIKNGVDNHSLTIQCEHSGEEGHRCAEDQCGKLNATGINIHAAAIGSCNDEGIAINKGGFSNLYIKGGIITARGGEHSPGIGTMCGTAHLRDGTTMTDEGLRNPQMYDGEICKNINISGGRVYAYAGESCAAIGSGGAGPVDGIYISNGAFVHAEGGWDSPGIGSGGVWRDKPTPIAEGIYDVSNVIISGGDTVVEAIGSNLDHSHYIVPGIGCGVSWRGDTGTLTNVQAVPDDFWLAIIKQGTNQDDADYIDGTPSNQAVDILPDMYYTLVYFGQISKTASVNGGDEATGEDNSIWVSTGDQIRYIIDTTSWGEEVDGTCTIEDKIPAGMTLVTTNGTYTSGMTYSTSGGVTTVRWRNQRLSSSNSQFYFTVTVDEPEKGDAVHQLLYINQAKMINNSGLEIPSNYTSHRYRGYDISFRKVNEYGRGVSGAGFTLYKCTNTSSSHRHGSNCTWNSRDPYSETRYPVTGGVVTFDDLPSNSSFILVETTVPMGYKELRSGSYILIETKSEGSITMRGYGEFSDSGMVTWNSTNQQYDILNRMELTLTLSKRVAGDYGDKNKSFQFTVHLTNGDGVPITGYMSCYSYAISGVASPGITRLYFNSQGNATVSLKHGQNVRIQGLARYYSYTVTESATSSAGYTVSSTGASKNRITENASAIFTNTRNVSPPGGIGDDRTVLAWVLGIGGFLILCTGSMFVLRRRRK